MPPEPSLAPDVSRAAQPLGERMARLLRQLAQSRASESDPLHAEAQQLLREWTRAALMGRSRHRERSRDSVRSADEWMAEIFRSTERAIPREKLVSDFIKRWRLERNSAEGDGGPWLFHLQAVDDTPASGGLEGLTAVGVHPDAFAAACREHLAGWRNDAVLQRLFAQQQDIDGMHALWLGPSPWLARLLAISQRFAGEPDFWINAVVLPGDGRYETQALVLCYVNRGSLFEPEPPATLRQDLRLLGVVQLAWRQLEHQIRSLAALSEADRRELVQLIAPGLLHHEVGVVMGTLYAQAYEQYHLLITLCEAETDTQGPLHHATQHAYAIASACLRLQRVTHAFNNLDKRSAVEPCTLALVFDELRLLLTHRLGRLGVDLLEPDPAQLDDWHRPVVTDVVLLQQALLNLLNNAMNAMEDARSPPPRRIGLHLLPPAGHPATLGIVVSNNGPPIAEALHQEIFRRGYTTREQGHGQGLYLARLIANYLGGDLQLQAPADLPCGATVGFVLSLQLQLQAQQGVRRAGE